MAQTELVKRFLENRDAILGFIFALTRDYEAAEEIFQETSLAILQEAEKEARIVHFMAWAREIARRRVADYYRKTGKRRAVEQLSDSMAEVVCQTFAENEPAPEAQQARMKFLLECLERLAGRSRQVIEGFYHQRKSVKDIAAALNWQDSSVKVALSRARKALADCIQVKMQTQGAS